MSGAMSGVQAGKSISKGEPSVDGPRPIKFGHVVFMNLIMSGSLAFVWRVMGPDNIVFAAQAMVWSFSLSLLFLPVALALPPRWYGVRAGEQWLHRALGVASFGRLLERSGWNRRVVAPLRGQIVSTERLSDLLKATRVSMGIHALSFFVHLPVAALALGTGHAWGALWVMVPAVLIHLYPVLLQRMMVLRLRPLLERCQTSHPHDLRSRPFSPTVTK